MPRAFLLAAVPLAVEQQQALFQQPPEQEPQAVLLALPGAGPNRTPAGSSGYLAEQEPELPRLGAPLVHDGRAAVPQQRPRTDEGVDLPAHGLEKHDCLDVGRPGGRGRPEPTVGLRPPVVLGGALGEVGRREDLPGRQVDLEGGQLLHGGGNPPEDGVAVSVGDGHPLPVHAGLLLVVGVEQYKGAGERAVGNLAAPGKLPRLNDEVPHAVLDDPGQGGAPGRQPGIVQDPGEHPLQQLHLAVEVACVDAVGRGGWTPAACRRSPWPG